MTTCGKSCVERRLAILSRRSLLHAGLGSALAYAVSPTLAFGQSVAAPAAGGGYSVIVLWMNGGPSHIDTWDPKPGTKTGGSHKAIATKTKGMRICEHMPTLASMSDMFTVVRSVSTKEGNHQRAQYLMRTGYAPNPTVVHPSFGGWMSKLGGEPSSGLPAFVAVSGTSLGAGFLGVEYGPLVLPNAGEAPDNTGYGVDTDEARFAQRRQILATMDKDFATRTGDSKVLGRDAVYDKGERLMRSPDLGVFDLSHETDAARKAYGDTNFGRGCLVAARLVEHGVRYVEVTLDGWDTHKDNFGRTKKLMGQVDAGMSALLRDLRTRNLLSKTLVVWMGDFGRTPRINGDDGRDHYPQASSCVIAGARTRPGLAFGETDAEGGKVVRDALSAADLSATLVSAVALDPHTQFMTPVGRPIAVTDNGNPVRALLL